jgi:hypothetical protein
LAVNAILTTDNRALRDIAQNAPYEFIEILVNNETYGGGGIFGQFSTAAAKMIGLNIFLCMNSAITLPVLRMNTTHRLSRIKAVMYCQNHGNRMRQPA